MNPNFQKHFFLFESLGFEIRKIHEALLVFKSKKRCINNFTIVLSTKFDVSIFKVLFTSRKSVCCLVVIQSIHCVVLCYVALKMKINKCVYIGKNHFGKINASCWFKFLAGNNVISVNAKKKAILNWNE